MKNKTVAGVLALLFGIFGVHRFYLGQKGLGVFYFLLFFMGFGVTIASDGEVPLLMFPALVGFIDAILFFAMPDEEFNEKFNVQKTYRQRQSYSQPRPARETQYRSRRRDRSHAVPTDNRLSLHKRKGIDKFRNYDYEGAIEDFLSALDIKFEDPSTHFNLACSHSIMENADRSFYHLEKAIEYGFTDLKKIHHHDALAYIRSLEDFDDFVDNDYRQIIALPEPQSNLLDEQPVANSAEETLKATENLVEDTLLEQIIKLGDLRDKGILTDEEFASQKKKILGE